MPETINVRCPYCNRAAEFRESSASIYHGKDYGPIYICESCQAWCGCHKGTQTPLGRLANAELRAAKMAAHAAFDPHWKGTKIPRGVAYLYLSRALGIDQNDCHIGMFDVAMCKRVVEVCPLNIPLKREKCQYPTGIPGKDCGEQSVGRDEDLGIYVCEEHR